MCAFFVETVEAHQTQLREPRRGIGRGTGSPKAKGADVCVSHLVHPFSLDLHTSVELQSTWTLCSLIMPRLASVTGGPVTVQTTMKMEQWFLSPRPLQTPPFLLCVKPSFF